MLHKFSKCNIFATERDLKIKLSKFVKLSDILKQSDIAYY
jgi:hypothetical protein